MFFRSARHEEKKVFSHPSINLLHPTDMDLVNYYGEPEQWRIVCVREVLQMRADELELPDGWQKGEMQLILDAACCS